MRQRLPGSVGEEEVAAAVVVGEVAQAEAVVRRPAAAVGRRAVAAVLVEPTQGSAAALVAA